MHRLLLALAAVTLVAGCSSPTAPSQAPSAIASTQTVTPAATAPVEPSDQATPSATPTPSVHTIAIALKNGTVSPNGDRVELTKGEQFVLDITSDRDDEVHVHGFDKEIEVKAGDHTKVEMTADRTGRFEVESHHPELLIVVLQIR